MMWWELVWAIFASAALFLISVLLDYYVSELRRIEETTSDLRDQLDTLSATVAELQQQIAKRAGGHQS